jgi:SAM-dependent methyltransferase
LSDLLVLTTSDSESAHAPEFRYLLSHCLLQARQVFDRVEVAEAPPEAPPSRHFDAVLRLGGHVLIGRRSLEAMRDALSQGASEVRPHRLADTGLAARYPVHTLRGYERLEAAFLEAGPGAAAPSLSSSPVALLSPAATEPRIAHAGLYHEFIDYYGEVRSDVLAFIPPGAREVLEVGCGRGVTGRLIQETFGCRVTGVELNPVVAAEAARHLHKVLQGDVQTLEIEGLYDVVLALELVEHLTETEPFLTRARRLLAPGGRAIFSIPNVGHYSIVEDLIAGRWDYLPIGLLCYTHYRFFTRRTLEDWLRRCGIERFEIVPQKTSLPERVTQWPASYEADLESLATTGFYVLIHG